MNDNTYKTSYALFNFVKKLKYDKQHFNPENKYCKGLQHPTVAQ